jgi:hypothetical protein
LNRFKLKKKYTSLILLGFNMRLHAKQNFKNYANYANLANLKLAPHRQLCGARGDSEKAEE